MEMATAAEEEEQILKCGICLGLLNDPKVLRCRHAFCKDCISQHFYRNKQNCAPCPICREKYFPPKRKPEDLPSCSIVLFQLLQVRQKSTQECESCLDDSGVFICLKCRKWLCNSCKTSDCSKDIDDPHSNHNHDAHRPSEVPPDLLDIVIQSRCKACREHPEHDVQWFCTKCGRLVCQKCRTYNHLHHDITNIEDLSTEYCSELRTGIKQLQEKESENEIVSEGFRELLFEFNLRMNETETLKWQGFLDDCRKNAGECDRQVKFIKHLTVYGSSELIVDTFRDVEKNVNSIINKPARELLDFVRQFSEKLSYRLQDIEQKLAKVQTIITHCQTHKYATILHQQFEQGRHDGIINRRSVNSQMSTDQTDANQLTAKDNGDSLVCQMPGCQSEIACCICKVCKQWLCNSCQEKNCKHTQKHNALSLEVLSPFLCDVIKKGSIKEHMGHDFRSSEESARSYRNILKGNRKKLEKIHRSLEETMDAAGVLNPTVVGGSLDSCKSSKEECSSDIVKITELLDYANDRCVVMVFPEIDNSINHCMTTSDTCLQELKELVKANVDKVKDLLEQVARSPNNSEEGNTVAHVGFFQSLFELIKDAFDRFIRYFTGSG